MTTLPGTPQPTAPGVAATAPTGSMAAVVADPAPLGLAAFGITTMVLSAINTAWIGAAAIPVVLALALPFGGISQALAGMWAFRRGNTFAATAFTSFGAFWVSYWLLVKFEVGPIVAAGGLGEAHTAVGMYLFAWGVFTAYMFIASIASAKAVTTVFILLALTFFALSAGEWDDSSTWTHIGGYLGMATAVAALYTSFADVTNANFKRTILPTF
jgi:succinate-acetate transporter protein